MLDASAFRTVRRRTVKRVLPDFVEEERAVYRRHRDGQVHVVEFAAKKYGGGFTVDLGLHFEGLPPFPSYTGGVDRGASTCAFQHRLRHDAGNQFWCYGESITEAERTVEVIAEAALAAFDKEVKWGPGEALLAALPPDLMRDDSRIFAQLYDAATIEEQNRLSERMTMRQLLPAWCPLPGSTALLLAYLAGAHGRPPSEVREYLSLFAGDRGYWGPPWKKLARALAAATSR
jgi:hypothetical protein